MLIELQGREISRLADHVVRAVREHGLNLTRLDGQAAGLTIAYLERAARLADMVEDGEQPSAGLLLAFLLDEARRAPREVWRVTNAH